MPEPNAASPEPVPMKTQSPDTSPEAERVQIALLRQASGARRLQLAIELSQMVIEMAWPISVSSSDCCTERCSMRR